MSASMRPDTSSGCLLSPALPGRMAVHGSEAEPGGAVGVVGGRAQERARLLVFSQSPSCVNSQKRSGRPLGGTSGLQADEGVPLEVRSLGSSSAAPTPRPQEQASDCHRRHTVLHCHLAQVRRAAQGAGDRKKTRAPVWKKPPSWSERGSEGLRFSAYKAGSFGASQTLIPPPPFHAASVRNKGPEQLRPPAPTAGAPPAQPHSSWGRGTVGPLPLASAAPSPSTRNSLCPGLSLETSRALATSTSKSRPTLAVVHLL